jgi:hypothetical protein
MISTRRQWMRIAHHLDVINFALGLVIGLGVCAPLLRSGRVFLLDWSIGPHLAVVTPVALGLNGGLTAGTGGTVLTALLNRVLGGATTWVLILAFFPIAMVGAGRLAGRSRWSRIAAGTLYAVNPFVFNRLYVGHLPLLIGYALLPFAAAAAIRSLSAPVSRWSVTALWWAALTALSPHFAWIFGLVVVGVVIVAFATKRCSVRRIVSWLVVSLGALALMSMYLILPQSSTDLPTSVGSASLSLYGTNGDPHLGLFANVLSLYGFWRTGPGPELPKDVIVGWPFLMFAILLIVAVGAWHALRKQKSNASESIDAELATGGEEPTTSPDASDISTHSSSNVDLASGIDQRRRALLLLIVGIVGFFLALGNQGPTGALFLWAYNHVPFFDVMREPQKFLMLLALAYAVFFGWGVEKFSQIDVSPKRVSAIATAALIGIVLPLSYTTTIFDGLAGQINSSPLPGAYQQANRLMGDGVGNILYLPWHLYMAYPFTNGRVVNNVAATSFSRNVISGDDVQTGGVESQSTSPRSAYLERLYASGSRTSDFGALVAPLGVKYVVLAKAVDWSLYSWLDHQRDLKLVLSDSSLEVWRNEAYDGVGGRVAKLTTVANIGGLFTLANDNELGHGAVVIRSGSMNSSHAGVATSSRAVRQLSPVAYRIAPGTPGWIAVDTTYQLGWSLDGRSAIESAEGTVLVRASAGGGVLEFTPWRLVRLGYIVSAAVFFLLLIVVVVDRRRRGTARVN